MARDRKEMRYKQIRIALVSMRDTVAYMELTLATISTATTKSHLAVDPWRCRTLCNLIMLSKLYNYLCMLQINKPQPNKRISKPKVCFWLLYFLYLETYFEAEGAHCKMMLKLFSIRLKLTENIWIMDCYNKIIVLLYTLLI